MPRKHLTSTLSVAVIADSQETIDGLHGYFEGAGVASRRTRQLAEVSQVAEGRTAAVLFPDEFDAQQVITRVLALRAKHPALLLVVVTSLPQRLRPALDPDGRSLLPLVLPRPAFGWSILDAIRAHAAGGRA